ncbi:histidine ammonia-lyase [Evansella tamaricis]|uniref:Histidine ammonia-lyase n=1 Tax=Evansella tamaricis TaxID=2069301 RepID=A0ABS6JCP2_9BACI|nr:histidine ammonia-lyase [Evansella tamaricis]MBU9711430.1 histidine ammonia-lyase [Evansella tamaricis]
MITLTGNTLTMEQVKRVIWEKEEVVACKDALQKVMETRDAVDAIVHNGKIVYGVNTGFGKLSDVKIDSKDVETLQKNLIYSHACGVGEPFHVEISRTMILLRVNTLLKGYSGVRPELIDQLLSFLNYEINPVIPSQGSLGASGDLAPLAHLALTLIGEGEVYYQGEQRKTLEVLEEVNLKPIVLHAKEGLALINGTQAMTAVGAIAFLEAEILAEQADVISAMTLEALHGIIDAFDEEIHLARGHQEQLEVARKIRCYTKGSRLITHQGEVRVQDAYSLRCIPQVHGASRQTLVYVKEKLETEMNAATDNPLVFNHGAKILSGGNFHGQPIALAMDFLKIGVAELANISERRIERLVNPQLNDFPPFLSAKPGLESGAMIMQYVAASLVSENKTLAHPASVDSIPSSGNQEDHVSMGTIGARHAYDILKNARKVLAIEIICAMQAIEYRGPENLGTKTGEMWRLGRNVVPKFEKDRVFSKDIERMSTWLKEGDCSILNWFSDKSEIST